MKNYFLLLLVLLKFSFTQSQSVGIGTSTPEASSILELKSPNKGLLVPRMTDQQRLSISSPAQGVLVYQINADTGFYYFQGASWKYLTINNSSPVSANINRLLFFKEYSANNSLVTEYWLINYDGSNAYKIPITPPPGTKVLENNGRLTPDGKRLLFMVRNEDLNVNSIYSCLLDGTGLVKIVEGEAGAWFHIEDAR